jgi:ComF family protein
MQTARLREHATRWSRLPRASATALFDLLAPPTCAACGCDLPLPGQPPLLCSICRTELQTAGESACPRCGAPPVGDSTNAFAALPCRLCSGKRFRFQRAVVLGAYRDRLAEAVIQMKQQLHLPLTLAVGRLLADRAAALIAEFAPDVVAPVPAHWWKRMWRGINAPDLLAEVVAGYHRLPVAMDLLICHRHIAKQGTLLPHERWHNVRGAFRVNARYDIRGCRVLLVDDVMTTGATANETAKTLRAAGADAVNMAVVARGGMQRSVQRTPALPVKSF